MPSFSVYLLIVTVVVNRDMVNLIISHSALTQPTLRMATSVDRSSFILSLDISQGERLPWAMANQSDSRAGRVPELHHVI